MENKELGNLYLEAGMIFEQDNFTECGSKQATERKMNLHKRILEGRVTENDIVEIEPIFQVININIRDHIKVNKRSIFSFFFN